jgi:hypothetical protein
MKNAAVFFAVLLSATVCSAQAIETVTLPPAQKGGGMPLMEAFQLRKSQRTFSSRALTAQQLSNLLWQPTGQTGPKG